MWSKTTFLLLGVFLVAFIGFTAIDRVTFRMPQSVSEGVSCDFTPGDFTTTGQLKYSVDEAWWTSFMRKQEYLSSFSVALAIAFAGFALTKIRQIGGTAATGGAVGGSLLVGLTLSFSCLAPVLATVGIGLFANLGLSLVAIPKWLVALNTVLLTTHGFMYVSRKATSCPIASRPASAISAYGEMAK